MIHYLPAVHSDYEGFERLGRLATATKDLFAGELELDMSGVDSIDANMAAPLAADLARIADEILWRSSPFVPMWKDYCGKADFSPTFDMSRLMSTIM